MESKLFYRVLKILIDCRPIPELEDIPSIIMDDSKYCELKAEAQRLLRVFEQFQAGERILSIKELLLCMKKINRLTGMNQKEALSILEGMVKEKSSSNAAEILELQNIRETVKQQQEDHLRNSERAESFFKSFNIEISDFDALSWSKEKFLDLFPFLSDQGDTGLEKIKAEWNNMKIAIEKEKKTLMDLCSKAQELMITFKKLKNGSIHRYLFIRC
jgi:hypothetical protein